DAASTPGGKHAGENSNSRKRGYPQTLITSAPNKPALESKSRFEAYNRLQAAAVAFGENLPIPEIVVLGGQSDGKSTLLEALLGFRFNVREVEMGTRRPLILQMVHDTTAVDPRCCFQEEDSEEYGSPIVSSTSIADTIKVRTEALLRKSGSAVSSKPIVMRAEYAHCPNLTVIDTPGFVLKARKGEPESTPDEILSMVKSLASPPHRILLFLQQSSVEWCSSLWMDTVREIDPTFRRTVVVVSKFDNRMKEFTERWEVDRYLSASGYLGDNTHPFFVALPKERGTVSNEEFRRQILQVDAEVLLHLRDRVKGGFDEEKYKSHVGFSCLRDYLESELQKKYKEAVPATLALLEQRCNEVTAELNRLDCRIQSSTDVAHLRRSAMLHAASVCGHVEALLDGAAYPAPEQWGKTTEEEKTESGLGGWPGVSGNIKPPYASLRLYGGAAFGRVVHEFRFATYSMECPVVSREEVATILLAPGGRGGTGGISDAAADIARATAKSRLAPLLDTACDRLAFLLSNLFDIAAERNRHTPLYGQQSGAMDGHVGFLGALRHSFNCFIKDLSVQCKQVLRHHLDSVTSPYSHLSCDDAGVDSAAAGGSYLELSDLGQKLRKENVPPPPENNEEATPPGKGGGGTREPLRESQAVTVVPETPSPDQPRGGNYAIKKELDNNNNNGGGEIGARKRQPRMTTTTTTNNRNRGSSAYSEICSSTVRHFSRIREALIERGIASTLSSGFLTPCREELRIVLGLDLFAVSDSKFMEMFFVPGAIDELEEERLSLQKRQKLLRSCLNDFKNVARGL
ncbi:hypothetical protein M569_05370, partial [Genlisea aurea]